MYGRTNTLVIEGQGHALGTQFVFRRGFGDSTLEEQV